MMAADCLVLPLKPGIGYLTMYVSSTARNLFIVLISTFPVNSPKFFPNSLPTFNCVSLPSFGKFTVSHVGPWNKTGHSAHHK